MVSLIDLKWLKRCQHQLREMADDPEYARGIIEALNQDAELREELSYIYVRALRTLELSGQK